LLIFISGDTAPADFLGTGLGIFNLVSGAALLLASVIAGSLWNSLSPPATFLAGAVFAAIAAIALLASKRHGSDALSKTAGLVKAHLSLA